MEDLDSFDLYNDLDEFQEQQNKKSKEVEALEEKLAAAEQNVEKLKMEKKQMAKKLKTMEINFQNLLDTAKSEIRRKDQLIAQLRQEKDDICFRRHQGGRAHRIQAENNTQIVDKCEQKQQYEKNMVTLAQKETIANKESRECAERITDSVVSGPESNNQHEHKNRRELSKEREQHNNKERNRSRERERSRERARSRERGARNRHESSRERHRTHGSRGGSCDKSKDWRRNHGHEHVNDNKYKPKVERRLSRDQKQQRDSQGEERRNRGTKRERSRENHNATPNSERASKDTKRSRVDNKSLEKQRRVEDAYSSSSKKKEK